MKKQSVTPNAALEQALEACILDLKATYDAITTQGGPTVSLGQWRRLCEAKETLDKSRA